ncbi:hypothetical protein HBH89_248500 [Parastagonospora nodorum]|nr:hypothetical protein HBH89_248500 [Parastagonospora nodorum]
MPFARVKPDDDVVEQTKRDLRKAPRDTWFDNIANAARHSKPWANVHRRRDGTVDHVVLSGTSQAEFLRREQAAVYEGFAGCSEDLTPKPDPASQTEPAFPPLDPNVYYPPVDQDNIPRTEHILVTAVKEVMAKGWAVPGNKSKPTSFQRFVKSINRHEELKAERSAALEEKEKLEAQALHHRLPPAPLPHRQQALTEDALQLHNALPNRKFATSFEPEPAPALAPEESLRVRRTRPMRIGPKTGFVEHDGKKAAGLYTRKPNFDLGLCEVAFDGAECPRGAKCQWRHHRLTDAELQLDSFHGKGVNVVTRSYWPQKYQLTAWDDAEDDAE